MQIEAVVYREHTLGVLRRVGGYLEVEALRASVLKGAPWTLHPDPFHASPKDLRPATLHDFTEYRVKWHPDYIVQSYSMRRYYP